MFSAHIYIDIYTCVCESTSNFLYFVSQERLTKLGKDAENTRLDLNDQIIALSRKLESLEEFRQHKEELEAKLNGLEKELAENKEKNQEQVNGETRRGEWQRERERETGRRREGERDTGDGTE